MEDLNLMGSAYAESYETEAELTVASSSREERGRTGVYNAIIRWSLRVGVFLLPLFFLPWTTGILEMNKQMLLLAVAGIGLIAWLLKLVSDGQLTWQTGVFDKGVLAMLGATVIAAIFSMSRFNSIFGLPNDLAPALITIAALTVVYFLVMNMTDDGGLDLLELLVISLSAVLVYGLLQIFGAYVVRLPFAMSRAFNTVGSADGLGIVAAAALPLLGAKILSGWKRYIRLAGLTAAIVILIVLNWWVLWTVAIAGMVALIVFESLGHEKFAISRFVMPMTVIVIGVFLTIVGFSFGPVKNNLPVEVSPSLPLSFQVVKSALKENFLTGYGPTGFSMAFDKYGAGQLKDSTLSSAKFFSGQSAATTGAVEGGLLWLLALLVLLWGVIQAIMFYVREKGAVSPYGQAVWASLIAVFAAYFLYPSNLTLCFLTFLLLALATLSLYGDRRRVYSVEHNVALSLGSSLGFIGGLILVLVGAYFGASIYTADVVYAKALGQQNVTTAATDMTTAINWNGSDDTYYRAASQVALGLLSQEVNKPADPKDTQRTTRIQNYMSSAVNLAKTATQINPHEALNWENLGNVYQNMLGLVSGVDKLSEDAYNQAAALRPGDPSYANEIGSMYLAEAQLDKQLAQSNSAQASTLNQNATTALASAETNFKSAIGMSNNYGLAIYNLGIVYDQQNRLPEAIAQLEKVAPFNSNQPDLLFELGLLYYRNNQMDKAESTFQNVLVLQPDYANAHWYLSLIYQQKGDTQNAIAELQKIISVDANKDNQTVLDRLHQLQSGKPATTSGANQKPL